MKHFSDEKWIDFVNERITSTAKKEMEQHLQEGCKSCKEEAAMWRKVRLAGEVLPGFQPPEDIVRLAKAAFAGAGLHHLAHEAGSRVTKIFDSLLQPNFAGARSAGNLSRQVLYSADPFQIDLHIETKPDRNHIVVTGQILRLRDPEAADRKVRIAVSNLQGNVVYTTTNEFGEFSAEVQNSGDLQLQLFTPDADPLVLPLRDALGGGSTEASR